MKWIPRIGDHITVAVRGGSYNTIMKHHVEGEMYSMSDPRYCKYYDLSKWRYNLLASVKARLERKRNEEEFKNKI